MGCNTKTNPKALYGWQDRGCYKIRKRLGYPPADAAKPEDKRVTTGEYSNWRKKSSGNRDEEYCRAVYLGQGCWEDLRRINESEALEILHE